MCKVCSVFPRNPHDSRDNDLFLHGRSYSLVVLVELLSYDGFLLILGIRFSPPYPTLPLKIVLHSMLLDECCM